MKKITFVSGELSLEGMLHMPEGLCPFRAAIICHPHPLYGGSMDNNVVNSLFTTLSQASFTVLKFNFRGVGESEGEFSHGIGEQEDVSAAISFLSSVNEVALKRMAIVGYSAGAGFGLPTGFKDGRINAVAAISPPLVMFDFEFLRNCLKPKLLVSGGKDNFIPSSHFLEFCQMLPEPKEYHIIEW